MQSSDRKEMHFTCWDPHLCQAMPAAVMTMAFNGLPHFARTRSALSSFKNDASLLKDMTLSLNGLKVGTEVIAVIVSYPCSTLPKTMFSPSKDKAGPGPARQSVTVSTCAITLVILCSMMTGDATVLTVGYVCRCVAD